MASDDDEGLSSLHVTLPSVSDRGIKISSDNANASKM